MSESNNEAEYFNEIEVYKRIESKREKISELLIGLSSGLIVLCPKFYSANNNLSKTLLIIGMVSLGWSIGEGIKVLKSTYKLNKDFLDAENFRKRAEIKSIPPTQEEARRISESSQNYLNKAGESRKEIDKILKGIEPAFKKQQNLFFIGIISIIVVGILYILT